MIDSTILGQTAAKCMEDLDMAQHLDGGEVMAVGIVVAVNNEDGSRSLVKTYCSDQTFYRQLGIFEAASACIKGGTI